MITVTHLVGLNASLVTCLLSYLLFLFFFMIEKKNSPRSGMSFFGEKMS